ncbi:MAG: ATP-binding cassette domain-containing protein [Candidatus Sumerlaeota bacterium]|nr:ATP-binding cassette domain-containing protein [Candidatus Sumerlaeota bacterium]
MTQTKDQAIIRVENLAAGYEGQAILEHVSFEVREGEVFVILGGSGCGKSTLLKHIIGLYKPLSGKIFIYGDDIAQAEGRALMKILRNFGVTFQSGALFGSMTLLENIRLALEEYTQLPLRAIDLIARMKLKLVGLEGYGSHYPSELSGGMQKRAALARAMALDAKILFFDEPSAGLDPITSAGLDQLIVRLSRNLGITFVIVSHELASIYAVADRVIMLDKRAKTIVAEGRPRDLRDQSDNLYVRRFFNRETDADEE